MQMMSSSREQQYDSISPAIYPSTTYERDADLSYPKGKCYSRDDNPTCEPAETVLCQLEGGGQALLFSSGMAAAVVVFQSLRPGDTIIIPGTYSYFVTFATKCPPVAASAFRGFSSV